LLQRKIGDPARILAQPELHGELVSPAFGGATSRVSVQSSPASSSQPVPDRPQAEAAVGLMLAQEFEL
jgi:hypothetical protein